MLQQAEPHCPGQAQRNAKEIIPEEEADGGETSSEALVREHGGSHQPEEYLCSDQQKPANTGQPVGLACYV